MATAKEIVVKVIPSNIANEFVKKTHYSGKVVNNSKLHFGVFLNEEHQAWWLNHYKNADIVTGKQIGRAHV